MSSSPVKVDGREVMEYNKAAFASLREQYNVPVDFLKDFKFDKMRESGGKGGDMLAFVGEDYIVKQVTGGDQELLEQSAFVDSHVEHVKGESIIARIYMHFHVREDGTKWGGFDYFAQSNWLPKRKGAEYMQVYDLKGSRDDKTLIRHGEKIEEVHKRCWNVGMWSSCCWTTARHHYYEGKFHALHCKFHVSEEDKQNIMRVINRDAKWFMKHGLMDYSLVVGVIEGRPGQRKEEFPPGAPGSGQPWIHHCDDVTVAYYMGIIDYLQEWCVRPCRRQSVLDPRPTHLTHRATFGDMCHCTGTGIWERKSPSASSVQSRHSRSQLSRRGLMESDS
jgi:hypothetical protein